jgi:hypothetical protein
VYGPKFNGATFEIAIFFTVTNFEDFFGILFFSTNFFLAWADLGGFFGTFF